MDYIKTEAPKKEYLSVHIWELDGLGRLRLSFTIRLEKLIGNHLHKEIAKEIGLSTPTTLGAILRRKKKKDYFVKISSIFKLTDYFKIPRDDVEKNIERFKISSSVEWENAKINFPLRVSPLWFRCVGVGDFSIGYNGWRYYVIWHQNSTKPMRNLIRELIGLSPRYWLGGYSGKNERILIPSIIVDAICALLKISRNETNTEKYILSSLNLPKPFRVQILAQTVVDDGCCDKIHSRVGIHINNKKIINALHLLCKSLDYKTTIVTRKTGRYEKHNFYDLIFGIVDTFKFYQDIKEMTQKYGKFTNLWNKQERLEKIINTASEHVKSYKYKQRVLEIIKIKNKATIEDIRKETGLPKIKSYYLIANLQKSDLIKNVGYGVYSLM